MRRRNVKRAHERILEFDNIVLNPTDFIDFKEIFKNDHPLHMEIGMGKGKFIIEQALKNPDINYIGLEKYESVILQALEKAKDLNISNLIFICSDSNIADKFIKKGSISKIYLNFSDPWPKTRHIKRRLTSPLFLKVYEEISIKPHIEFKTDNRELFAYSLISFNNNGYEFLDLSLDLHQDKEEIITTEYEERFIKENKPIYFIEVIK